MTLRKYELETIIKNDLNITTTEDREIPRVETLTNDLRTIKKIEKYMKDQRTKEMNQEIYKVCKADKSHIKELSKN